MTNWQPFEPQPNQRLVLATLGRAALECVSESGPLPVELLGPGKPLALVVYLACSPGRTASREHLIDLLWADQDVEAGRHSVRQALWYLRQRLGGDVIVAKDSCLALCPPIETDRDEFLTAVQRVEIERAVGLYRGDFLPGFAAPGGADFEQWADVERFRLRRLFMRLAETLVRDWLAKGRLGKAKTLATRVRDADRQDERGWRLLIESHLAANDHVGAELEARALEWLLVKAERHPEPATRTLLELAHSAPASSPVIATTQSLTVELIGREREFSTLLQAWDAARRGSGRHLHITGAPGLGKSRLLADVHARIRAGGGRAVLVRANPGERLVPGAFASELAAALARLPGAAAVSPASAAALVALNPSLSSCYGAPADRASNIEALRHREIALGELLDVVADEHPVAIMIDDVHWADDDSRTIVSHVLAHVPSHPVFAVTTARPGPGSLAPGDRMSGERLVLQPLTVADIAALLASLARSPGDPWADYLPEGLNIATRGVPLLILETLNLLIERGVLALDEGNWTCTDPAMLSAELVRGGALARRIKELERDPRWLLQLLAVAGTPVATDVLVHAVGRDAEAVQVDLHVLEVRGLVTRDGGGGTRPPQSDSPSPAERASEDARVTLDRAVLDHISDAIFIADGEGRILAANPATSRLTGYLPGELLTLRLTDLVPKEDLEAAPPRLAELFAKTSLSSERRVRCRDGALIEVEINWTVLPDGRVLGSARDLRTRLTRRPSGPERRGMGGRSSAGPEWQAAHDEIAARALELATPEALRAAHDALGRQLAASGHDNPRVLQRAGRHLAAAGNDRELGRVFTRRVLLQRRRAERRPVRTLAAEVLGDAAAPAQVSRLVRALPFHIRLGLTSTVRIVAASGALLALGGSLAGAALLRRTSPTPDIILVAIRSDGDSLLASSVPIRRDGWESGDAIALKKQGHPYPGLAATASLSNPQLVPRPDGTGWAFSRVSGDSGDIDLYFETAGSVRRLTSSPGDDYAPSWSPDGKQLAFVTTLGNTDRYAHLAILDLESNQVTLLTHGEPGDGKPSWSPDGTRIAYQHSPMGGRRADTRICLITVDGRSIGCLRKGVVDLRGWYDPDQLLVGHDSAGHSSIARLDLHSGETVIIDRLWQGSQNLSSDGHWVACWCSREGLTRPEWRVYPIDRPDLARRVDFSPDSGGHFLLLWGASLQVPPILDRVELSTGSDSVVLGTEVQLSAQGVDPKGTPAALATLSWQSDNPAVATVDESTGVLRTRGLGTVAIRVSAGGWRETTRTIVVVPPVPAQLVLSEDWSDTTLAQPWVPFGDPRPTISEGPNGVRAFWNRGDGWFVSGAYSRRQFEAARGLAVEAQLSTPVTGPRQQFVHISLASGLDSATLQHWDHRTGNLPTRGAETRQCDFIYAPGDEIPVPPGTYFGGSFVPLPTGVNSGRWFTVRLQVLLDGRCGVAVNGRTLAVAPTVLPVHEGYRLVIEGNSVGNRMLVGPLRVWLGVPNDVDWTSPDRAATSRPEPPPPSSRRVALPRESPQTAPRPRTPRPRP